MERIVERVNSYIPAQPRALRVCAYARVSTGKDAMLHTPPGTMDLWSGTKKQKYSLNSSALQRLLGKTRQKPSEHLCLRCRNWVSSSNLMKNSG